MEGEEGRLPVGDDGDAAAAWDGAWGGGSDWPPAFYKKGVSCFHFEHWLRNAKIEFVTISARKIDSFSNESPFFQCVPSHELAQICDCAPA